MTELIRVRESCSNIVWLDLELASLDDPTILVLCVSFSYQLRVREQRHTGL